jgi:hypothetical protein
VTSPIIARADALMQRSRRPAGDDDDIPLLTDAIDEEEDGLPVLIDVAADHDASIPVLSAPKPQSGAPEEPYAPVAALPPSQVHSPAPDLRPTLDPVFRDLLAGEVAARVEKRIAELLPGIVSETVCEVLTELVEGQPPK